MKTEDVLKKLFDANEVTLYDLEGKEVRTVKIKKVTLRTMKPILDLIQKVFTELEVDDHGIPKALGAMLDAGIDPQSAPQVILKLISDFYEDITSVVAGMTELTEDEFMDMDIDHSVAVVLGVVELNKDFFIKRVLPLLTSLGGTGEAPKETAKPTQSSGQKSGR